MAGVLLALGCAGNRAPAAAPTHLEAYDIVIRGRDSLSLALIGAFSRAGFSVRDDVKGGGRQAAALAFWRFVDEDGHRALEAQLADTRRGTVLAVTTIPGDTLLADLAARADLIVHGLLNPSP